jgi:CheY-like chemotaxis protein
MNKAIEILLVEDNPADIKLTQVALKRTKISNNINVVRDGDEAISYLRKQGEHANAVRPDLILLDLNLPRKSGHETLLEIKSDEQLKTIPVVILTSSDDQHDISRTYSNHANSFITKPVDLAGFVEVVTSIENFWFTIVTLPGGVVSP